MIKSLCSLLLLTITFSDYAQALKTKNIVLVTLDGYRWQELFNGADSSILYNKKFVTDTGVREKFYGITAAERREKLMPFFWNVIGTQGQLYGNRKLGNKMDCSNPFLFSYPGYSELLVGFVDKGLHSNKKIENPNSNVLEFIERQPEFEDRVAVFSTWDVMSAIVRESVNGIPVNACNESSQGALSDRQQMLNELQQLSFGENQRPDVFTFYQAFEYAKRNRPRVMFISFDETDAHAHGGRYDEYLKSAHKTDKLLQNLWEWIQSESDYKDQTTLLITTDHGRGKNDQGWKEHGQPRFNSSEIWMAAIGPDTPPAGERRIEEHFYQNQIAATIASLLGFSYSNTKVVGHKISPVIFSETLTEYSDSGLVHVPAP